LYDIYYRFLETEDEYFDYAPAEIPPQGCWRIYGLDLIRLPRSGWAELEVLDGRRPVRWACYERTNPDGSLTIHLKGQRFQLEKRVRVQSPIVRRLYDPRETNVSSSGIETGVVEEYSGGWVPFRIAATRISIAIPVSGER
jgi:hypothetical protein